MFVMAAAVLAAVIALGDVMQNKISDQQIRDYQDRVEQGMTTTADLDFLQRMIEHITRKARQQC